MDYPKLAIGAEELVRRYATGERSFHSAHLVGAELPVANLRDVDLRVAKLERANLEGANLGGANLRVAKLERANLTAANLTDANLDGADLTRANLSAANLSAANLGKASLSDANLTRANLRGAYLGDAYLGGANLSGADLSDADLGGADLSDADLSGANLFQTNLHGADLSGTNLSGTRLYKALLTDVDLSALCEHRSTLVHYAPSTVDHVSVLRSIQAPGLKEFLAQAGMPEVIVEYTVECALSLTTEVFKLLRSTFISYGSPDEDFARKLYEALHRNGVTTFFFPEHAVPGEKLHRMMRTKVNELDRILLVCSKDSLDRKGVANEIEETLTREARDGGAAYLIPITIDDYVFSAWKPPNPDTAQAVLARVVADFRGADADPAKFQSALLRLIAALKK